MLKLKEAIFLSSSQTIQKKAKSLNGENEMRIVVLTSIVS